MNIGETRTFLTRKPAVLDKLVEIAKIQSVEDSNRIEGIVTTAVRIKELVNKKKKKRRLEIGMKKKFLDIETY